MPTPAELGWDAYRAGAERSTNPYKLTGAARLAWFKAYDDAAAAQDTAIDRWHEGYFMRRDGKPRPTEANAAEGWDHRDTEAPSAPVERPEGYYHMALDPEGC